MTEPLTNLEKSYFDTIKDKSKGWPHDLQLMRMTLDSKDVAVILTPVSNRFTGQPEGLMPLAMILNDTTIAMLREVDGQAGVNMSPFDLDPGK